MYTVYYSSYSRCPLGAAFANGIDVGIRKLKASVTPEKLFQGPSDSGTDSIIGDPIRVVGSHHSQDYDYKPRVLELNQVSR